jgi:hypothetical protein
MAGADKEANMSFRELKASDGCVIFFPSRDPKGKRPRIISGPEKSKRGWGEEWVQFRLDLVTLEVRLEGDTAVDLGNDLRCDVVARVLAHIDEDDLAESLTKIVVSLRCTTTTDPQSVLTGSFFRERLNSKFRATVEHIVSEADYLKLLDSPTHRGDLQTSFAIKSISFLGECGFALVSSEIRFRPLNPGILGSEEEISEKWIEQERAQAKLEAKKQAILDNMEDVKRKEAAERTARVEQELKAIELQKKESERDNSKRMHQIEIEMQNAQDDKERTLAEARRDLEEFFRKRQEEKDAYEHERKLEEQKDREQLKTLEADSARAAEEADLEHKRRIQEGSLAALDKQLMLATRQLEIDRIKCEGLKVRGLVDAEVIESRIRAEGVLQHEETAIVARWIESLVDRLPEIVSKLPCETGTSRTIVQLGGGVQDQALGGVTGIMALTLAPAIQQILEALSERLTQSLHEQGPNVAGASTPQSRAKGPHESDICHDVVPPNAAEGAYVAAVRSPPAPKPEVVASAVSEE